MTSCRQDTYNRGIPCFALEESPPGKRIPTLPDSRYAHGQRARIDESSKCQPTPCSRREGFQAQPLVCGMCPRELVSVAAPAEIQPGEASREVVPNDFVQEQHPRRVSSELFQIADLQ